MKARGLFFVRPHTADTLDASSDAVAVPGTFVSAEV